MPGSKRRALKNLLSPHKSPSSDPPIHPAESGASLSSITSAQSASSIASNPANYMTDQQLDTDLELAKMQQREKSIGHGGGVPDMEGLPPAETSVPPPAPQQAVGRQGEIVMGLNGDLILNPANGAAGASGVTHEPESMGAGGKKKKSSKQKFEERQARKKEAMLNSAPPSDPHWDAKLEKERQEEIQVISDACTVLGREIHEITPDGHCMYHAISHQLASIGLIPADQANNPSYTRKAAAQYMMSNPDEFRFFLASVNGEDTAAAETHEGVMTENEYKRYCDNVENTGEWGGEPEIQALSRSFQIPIHVIQRGPPTIVSHGGPNDTAGGSLTPQQSLSEGDRVVRISYHRRMYGLGEHYNSLQKITA